VHELQLALCASVLVLWQACRPSFGRILYGERFATKKIKLTKTLEEVQNILVEILTLREHPNDPPGCG